MKGKKFFCFLTVLIIACIGLFADGITVAVDSTSDYEPTQIKNGSFDDYPWMTYTWNNKTYSTWAQEIWTMNDLGSGYTNKVSNVVFHGVGEGWNTTETNPFRGSLFEYIGYLGSQSYFTNTLGKTDYNHNDYIYKDSNYSVYGGKKYVELNCSNAATLYQDLYTVGKDVIRWTLGHAVVSAANDVQSMRVEIGAPNVSGGKIVNASGTGSNINTNIQASTLAVFRSTGVTNAVSNGKTSTIGFPGSDIANLSLKKSSQNTKWYTASGVYCIPEGQTVTRFAFVSEANTPTKGNLLDDITFSTLIGNLHGNYNTDGSISIYGYWGETDTNKKLMIKPENSTTPISVDVSSVCGKNFVITLPASYISSDCFIVDVYHQDYEVAKRSIHIHKWEYISNAQQIIAYCTNTECTEQCDYQGKDKAVDVLLATNRADMSAGFNPSNTSDDSIVWSSNNTGLATIDSTKGILKAAKDGATTITATSLNGSAKASSVAVKILPSATDSSVKVTKLTLNKSSVTITAGNTETLTATVTPTNAAVKTVTFISSDSTIAKVNSSTGVVTGVSSGTATITAIANDGSNKTASCKVTVVVPVTGVSLNRSSMSVTLGSSSNLYATIVPIGATNSSVTWSSDNEDVATVTSNGVVTANALGSANITVTTADGGYSASCSVTIVAKEKVATPVITPDGGSYNNAQAVTINTSTSGADIYYTTDGSVPTTASTKYVSSFNIAKDSAVIKAIAVKSDMLNSDAATSSVFNFTVSDPQIIQDNNKEITIVSETSGATIMYTTDGSDPTATVGSVYTEPFTVSSPKTTVKAFAYLDGMTSSAVTSQAVTNKPKSDENEDTTSSVTYTKITFGSYPQSEIVSQASDCGVNGKSWATESDYIVDSSLYTTLQNRSDENWDSNGDTTIDGNKYRRIKKANATSSKSGDDNYYEWSSSDTSYHYFKYEPIEWRVLKQDSDKVLLLSETVLDDKVYNTNITGTLTWENSTLRSWLNGYSASVNECETDFSSNNFIGTAFTADELNKIKETSLATNDNSNTGTEGGNNTTDRIFVLAEEDLYGTTGQEYGFAVKADTNDTARQVKSSTYAKAMGAFVNNETSRLGNSYWWIRTPGSYPGLFILVRDSGSVYIGGQHANSKTRGVRPALYVETSVLGD